MDNKTSLTTSCTSLLRVPLRVDTYGKFNFRQDIWDKSVVLLGTFWETHWELDDDAKAAVFCMISMINHVAS